MKFGMIGVGTVAQAIAGHVVKAGHEVVFSNSRGPHTLGEVVAAFEPHASAGTVTETGAADFVVLAGIGRGCATHYEACLPARGGSSSIRRTSGRA
jgi:NADP oxidoreductase coenzyme F420-dependent